MCESFLNSQVGSDPFRISRFFVTIASPFLVELSMLVAQTVHLIWNGRAGIGSFVRRLTHRAMSSTRRAVLLQGAGGMLLWIPWPGCRSFL